MPLSNVQLAALVERARQKPPLVASPPPAPAPTPQRAVRTAKAASAPPLSSPAQFPARAANSQPRLLRRRRSRPPKPRIFFRRPMARGEYSHLLWQIRRAKAEHGEDCWRVTLPGGSRTLPVRGTVWRLITILPKNWQPATSTAPSSSGPEHAQEPSLWSPATRSRH
jgi:hypothetical protein